LSRDPLAENGPQVLSPFPDLGQLLSNPYAYVGNQPVNLTDPSGLAPKKYCGKAKKYTGDPKKVCDAVEFNMGPKKDKDAFCKKIAQDSYCKFVVCGTEKEPRVLIAGGYIKTKRTCEHIVLSTIPKLCDFIWAAGQCLRCGNVIVINYQTGNYGGCKKDEYLEIAKEMFEAAGFEVQFATNKTDITRERCADHPAKKEKCGECSCECAAV
jgi:hypothetical protein